jgi:vacuolar-type H+-ATPase subunit F/Vma7
MKASRTRKFPSRVYVPGYKVNANNNLEKIISKVVGTA